jgi:site-specific DNA-cytosine methylase
VAWHPIGWKAAWLAEIEPFPCAVLAHHYPSVPNLGDMTTIARRVLTEEVPAPDVFCGGTPCFTAGHMVITQRGYVPIEEIVVGDMVVTHKGRLRRVVRIGSKIARVGRLSGVGLGEKISCTPDHPFRSVEWRMQNTKRGNKYERVEHIGDPSWTAAKDMPGSQWCALTAVSVDAPVMPDGIDADELLYIAGFYLGDGFIRRWADANKKAVVFGVNDEKVDRFKARVTQSVSVLRERTGPRIVLGNTAIADWLIENFGEYSHAKTLPAWVLAHPQRAALMDGYRDTDGHCTANGWRAISVSRALAYGMRDLAQTLGMVASVAFTKVEPTKTIEGRKVNQRDYWTVTAFNGETSRKSRIRHGMLLRTVSAFEEVGDETVFNIEVDEDHSYVLDGVIVHNCQAFSVAGLRESLSDERGNLTLKFVEIADAIDHVRVGRGEDECIVFWENVPGVLSTKDNAFGCFLGGLAGEDGPLEPPGGKWANAGAVYGPARAVAWRTLDAQYFGVAQRRRRVFVVASARKGFDPATVLFEFDGMRRDTAPSREAGKVAPTIPSRSTAGGGLGTDFDCDGGVITMAHGQGGAEIGFDCGPRLTCNHEAPIAAYGIRTANTSSNGWGIQEEVTHTLDCAQGIAVAHARRGEGFDASEDGTGRGTPLVPVGVTIHGTDPTVQKVASLDETAQCLRARTPGNIDNSSTTVVMQPVSFAIQAGALRTNPLSGPGGIGVQADHAYTLEARAEVQAVAVALRGREGGATAEQERGGQSRLGQTPFEVRRLTCEEAEFLQGFPRGYTAIPWRKKPASECPDGPRYRALGNSWAVPVIRWIGRRIDSALSLGQTQPSHVEAAQMRSTKDNMTEPLQTILDRREVVIKILERDAQDAHDKLANAAPPVQVPDSIRVPLDSLHADAEYLLARLLAGTLTREQVVGVIRDRIDAARLEIDGLRTRVQELGAMLRENRSKRIVALETENLGLLHALAAEQDANTDLRQQLEAIGAGGVEPLRKRPRQIEHDHFRDATKMVIAQSAPAAVAGPVAYRVLRKRHDGEWVTDGRAWCDGVPTQDLVDDIALRSEGWRIEYAFAAPTTQPAPVAQGDAEDAASWRVINEQFIDDYLEDYELIGEAEGVGDCRYTPTETERDLIKDAVMGLLAVAEDAARAQAKEGEIHE